MEAGSGFHRQCKIPDSLNTQHIIPELVKSEIKLCFSFSQSFLYLAWYMFVSVLGHYNNFFFAAHLLDIAMGFKTLRTILSSVTHNGKQVLHLVYVCVSIQRPQNVFKTLKSHFKNMNVIILSL